MNAASVQPDEALAVLHREVVGAGVVDVDHDITRILKVTHHICEAVVAEDEAVGGVLEVIPALLVIVYLPLDALDIDGDGLLCHADGGGLVCDGGHHVVHLVVDHDTIAEHDPIIHLDEKRVGRLEVEPLTIRVQVRGDVVRHEAHPVPPSVLALVMDDLDDIGVNSHLFTQAFVVLVLVVNPLVDILLDKSLAEFGGHHVLDAAAGGV